MLLAAPYVEELAEEWGLETVEPAYFFTQRRWDEHRKGLERGAGAVVSEDMEALADRKENPNDPSWDGKEYLPQGTVGAVVLDASGTICAATSTGGLTNKLPGRIGDTPTLGAGYWAEEWLEDLASQALPRTAMPYQPPPAAASPLDKLSRGDIAGVLSDCLPSLAGPSPSTTGAATPASSSSDEKPPPTHRRRAVGMSGTGNGDSFLRVCAARTAAAIARFSAPGGASLADALRWVAGPGGELQRSAGDRWKVTGEGEGGIIGIELVGAEGRVVYDLNCGGMFRAWVDDEGRERVAVFADEDGTEGW
ncbi:hypothetical protein SLS56_000633 [Neofusicoccum ribis]|uniref:L-asparaginase n=1 Tax=Neofusicoccum ribis TaxID=45134 RepID=A0ABR3TD79_9PEZI